MKLSVTYLRKRKLLTPGLNMDLISWGDFHVQFIAWIYADGDRGTMRLMYYNPLTKESHDFPISLVSTPCHFGGRRFWFQCWRCSGPDVTDKRRSGVLYFIRYRFICRICANVGYESQLLSGPWKRFGKMDLRKLREDASDSRWMFYGYKATKRQLRILKQLDKEIPYMEEVYHNFALVSKRRLSRAMKEYERVMKIEDEFNNPKGRRNEKT